MKSLIHALSLTAMAAGSHAQTCTAQSTPEVPQVVELYTSEGCSSCPPADRWLSTLKPGSKVIAAAFHVDYWNGLGWPDRFSAPAFTERQQQGLSTTGARYAYTPQLVVDGRDTRQYRLAAGEPRTSTLRLTLTVEGTQAKLAAHAEPGTPARVRLWWARLEDGHETRVRAGENRGEVLRHDHVVRDYARLPVWDLHDQGLNGSWTLPGRAAEPGHATRWIAVATDAATGRVLQALASGC